MFLLEVNIFMVAGARNSRSLSRLMPVFDTRTAVKSGKPTRVITDGVGFICRRRAATRGGSW